LFFPRELSNFSVHLFFLLFFKKKHGKMSSSRVANIASPSEWYRAVTDQTTDSISVFFFYDKMCYWCNSLMSPVYETLAKEYGRRVAFYKVCIDDLPDLSARQHAASSPVFIFYRCGEQVGRSFGRDIDNFKEKLASFF
jgi:thioredoxin-like negative regulator of GroEL